ncbi:MAG: leucine--tRNA ligase [Candidatus Altiarchaeales archaeon]|nr:MAG: leucine--tRNA ligase [Candidatus Altiarchaeales archaeon]
MTNKFNLKEIEEKWKKRWEEEKIFNAISDKKRRKFYLTVAYPYPSGSMHVGHGRTYTVPDIIARYKRMQGYNVLFPMAWHVTGSPVLGIAERIRKRDPKTLMIYGKLYKVPEEKLKEFEDPRKIVEHFSDEYKRDMKNLGLSIDWTREFLTITPQYQRFIEWQYRTLYSKGLVRKGKHPVRYCPSCDNPVGDHDLLEGEDSVINEFTIIKFKFNNSILPAATLRPETLFGVTNIWLNPKVRYVRARVDGEIWILSRESVEKLRYLDRDVEVLAEIDAGEIIGKFCRDPINDREIPILPAEFVDPDYATGVVMSVPAHAPYDYVALRDIGSDIKPIVIIESDDNEKIPAKDIVERMNIKNQRDSKLEEATEILYREEYAKGRMKKSIERYGNMSVRECRERLSRDLIKSNHGDLFYEFSKRPVVCRCGTRCFVKILKDQWFLRYSDEKWKEKAHECLSEMNIIPKEIRQNFQYFIDWLKDWACTRRVGLGTVLPWDRKWIVEPLSDSTIYMSYYTISHHLRKINSELLSDEFFDYVFLGNGDADKISKNLGIPREKLNEIRNEFAYWYPAEWRLSAKDLVGNHLTFHIFHHTAIFPKKYWPRGIVVFGMGLLDGQKMSSSKGNIILLSDAIEKYGGDTVRLFLMSNAEPWQDFDWRDPLVKNTLKKLKQFYDHVNYAITLNNDIPLRRIDRWLLSRFEETIMKTINSLENFQIRKALQHAFFDVLNDLAWYSRRCKPNSRVLRKIADKWVRLMAPFIPFTCEELWSRMNKDGFVSIAEYPTYDKEKIDHEVLFGEELIRNLIDDIQKIMRVTKVKAKKIYLYIAEDWKRELFKSIKNGESISEIMKKEFVKGNESDAIRIIKRIRPDEIPEYVFDLESEFELFNDAREFLEREFNAMVEIQKTPEYDPENRARLSLPMRPGIYIE